MFDRPAGPRPASAAAPDAVGILKLAETLERNRRARGGVCGVEAPARRKSAVKGILAWMIGIPIPIIIILYLTHVL